MKVILTIMSDDTKFFLKIATVAVIGFPLVTWFILFVLL